MKKFSTFLVIMFLFSASAMAYDDLLSLTHYSSIGEQGSKWGNIGLRYSTAGDMLDKDGEKQSLPNDATGIRIPIWASHTLREKLQVFAILPIVSTDDGTNSESGIGDIWLGAKYAVIPEDCLTIRGALDIPTGDDVKGLGNAGGFGIDIAALTQKQMDKFELQGQLGIRYNGEDSDTKWKPGIGFYLVGRAEYAFTEKIGGIVGLTYFNQGDGEAGGTELKDSKVNWLEISIGGYYSISEDFWVAPVLDYTLTGSNTLAELSIGVYVGYQIMK